MLRERFLRVMKLQNSAQCKHHTQAASQPAWNLPFQHKPVTAAATDHIQTQASCFTANELEPSFPFQHEPVRAAATDHVHIPYCLAVTPCSLLRPPPIFGRNYCIGYFTSITRPPPQAARAGLRYCSSCTCTRVASVEELYLCIKRVENSLRTGLGLFR